VQPAMGLLSDRSLSRFGRRRPFIAIGTLLDLVFLAFVALSWNYWVLLVAVLLQQFSANISHGALQGLIPDRVPEGQRGMASAVKAIMELLPLILLAFSIAKLMGAGQLVWAIVATGAALLATMLITLLLVKEEPLTIRPNEPIGPPMLRVLGMLGGILAGGASGLAGGALIGGVAGLATWAVTGQRTAWAVAVGVGGVVAMAVAVVAGVWVGTRATLGKAARQQSSFTWWVINRLMFLAALTSIQGFAPYFLQYAFHTSRELAASMTGNLMLAVGIFTLITALPSGWLSDRYGQRLLVGVSGVLAALGTGLLLTNIWMPNLAMIYVAGCILGLSAGLFVTVNWALGANLVPPTQAGRYLGVSNLAGAGAGMIGAGIGAPVADFLNGYTPGLGYFVVFAGYGLLFLLSTVSLGKVHVRAAEITQPGDAPLPIPTSVD
ncbi:MAG: MFS transporter, partial [Anaerolineaceae bacterium]|nr:MFS transporter [Anaerolineaceae bacterium]